MGGRSQGFGWFLEHSSTRMLQSINRCSIYTEVLLPKLTVGLLGSLQLGVAWRFFVVLVLYNNSIICRILQH